MKRKKLSISGVLRILLLVVLGVLVSSCPNLNINNVIVATVTRTP